MNRHTITIALAVVLLTGCRSPWAALSRKTDVEQIPGLKQGSLDDKSPESSLSSSTPSLQGASMDALLRRADREMQHGDLEVAKNLYRQALAIKADNPTAHHRLAIIADRQSDFDSANFHYEFARRSNGNNPDLLNDMGYSYYLQGNYHESERLLQQALQLRPTHRDALNNLGQLYAVQGKQAAAASLLRQANAESNPDAALVQSSREFNAPAGTPRFGSNLIGDTLGPLYAPELRPGSRPGAAESGALADARSQTSTGASLESDISATRPRARIIDVSPSEPTEQAVPSDSHGPREAINSEWNRFSTTGNAAAENLASIRAAETMKPPSAAPTEPQSSVEYPRAGGNIDPLASMPAWPPATSPPVAKQPLPAASTPKMITPANYTAPAVPTGYGQPQRAATNPPAAASPNTLPTTTTTAEQPTRSFRDPW